MIHIVYYMKPVHIKEFVLHTTRVTLAHGNIYTQTFEHNVFMYSKTRKEMAR